MADRNDWERDRERERAGGRWDWDRGREWGENWEGNEYRGREDWGREEFPRGGERYREHGERGERGEWGRWTGRPEWYRAEGRERGREHWRTAESPGWAGERGRFAGRGPKNYKRSDERILEEVNERLTENPYLDATDIEVRISEGEVTLSGAVDDRRAKRLAEDIAESVFGVKDVHNELKPQRQPSRMSEESERGAPMFTRRAG
jgi:BON domain